VGGSAAAQLAAKLRGKRLLLSAAGPLSLSNAAPRIGIAPAAISARNSIFLSRRHRRRASPVQERSKPELEELRCCGMLAERQWMRRGWMELTHEQQRWALIR